MITSKDGQQQKALQADDELHCEDFSVTVIVPSQKYRTAYFKSRRRLPDLTFWTILSVEGLRLESMFDVNCERLSAVANMIGKMTWEHKLWFEKKLIT